MPAKKKPAAEFKEYPEPEFPGARAREAYRAAKRIIRGAWNRIQVGEEVTSLGSALVSGGLTALPPEIGQLTTLKELSLQGNQLTALPPEIGQLTALAMLSLHSNRLMALPPEIGQLMALAMLSLHSNRLMALPPEIGQLTTLKELSLQGNPLTALPPEIGQLSALTGLFLSGSQLTALPPELRRLTKLERLFLHNTPLAQEIPESLLGPTWQEVRNNKATPGNLSALLDYYFSTRRASRPLNEARVLVVGRGEAGKTSLCRVLMGQGFREQEGETAGIEIGRLDLRAEETADGWRESSDAGARRLGLHLWDFAGQEITYALHRFFLAQHALYLLVLENRAGTAAQDAEDWLRTIAAYAGKPHVLVVMTKQDKHPFHLDTEKLRRRWGKEFAGMDFLKTDAKTGRGMADLRRVLLRTVCTLPEVNQPFPVEYQDVKARCEEMKQRGEKRLTLEQFRTLCAENGIAAADGKSAEERADSLARTLHHLGVVLHFVDDPRLKENTVLDPQWVTNGVYKLLRAREKAAEEAESRGAGAEEAVLTVAKACAALPGETREGVKFLLRLMERFEMIYVLEDPPALPGEDELEGCQWFMPAVLPEYQPELTPALLSWRDPDESELRLRFTYPLLPEGLAPRFIVRTWPLNEEMPRWRSGCFLREGRAEALISAERLDRTVEITVRGPEEDRVRLGRLVARHMEAIHKDVPEKPKGEILVRVDLKFEVGPDKVDAGREQIWKSINTLLMDEAMTPAGESTVETTIGTEKIKAATSLEAISGRRRREWLYAPITTHTDHGEERWRMRRFAGELLSVTAKGDQDATKPTQVFVSYAHRDKRVCDVVMQNLAVMEQDGLIEAWTDNMIPSGEQWDEEIKTRLNEADIFLALVSTAFLASKYIANVEIPLALARHKEGKLKLAWVMVEPDCAWKDQDFAKLQVILPGGRAVRQWGRMQDAFNAVEKTLRQMVAR